MVCGIYGRPLALINSLSIAVNFSCDQFSLYDNHIIDLVDLIVFGKQLN